MIRVDLEQGSPEWFEARSCTPTASCMGEIITPEGKPSKQAAAYMNKLLAEWYTGEPDGSFENKWTKHGHQFEPEACRAYEFEKDVVVEHTGVLYLNSDKMISCSPDGLICDIYGAITRGLEVKCPKGSTFIEYMTQNCLPGLYKPQVQSSMYVAEVGEWDFIAYHWKFKPMILRVYRDDVFLSAMEAMLREFNDEMLERREWILKHEADEYLPAETTNNKEYADVDFE